MSQKDQIEEQLIRTIRGNLNSFLQADPTTKGLYGYSRLNMKEDAVRVFVNEWLKERGLSDTEGEYFETVSGFIEHCLEDLNLFC